MEQALCVVLAHYIADYPLQGSFLAQSKGTNWYSLFAHCVIYSLVVALSLYFIGAYSLWKVAVLLASHIVIDCVKSKAKNKSKALTTYLYIDQALHLSIAIGLIYM